MESGQNGACLYDFCDLSDLEHAVMKPINAFPLIAMLAIVVIIIAMLGGYF